MNDTYENMIAMREGREIRAENDYFEARPQADTNHNRHIFREGFNRGFDAIYAQQAPIVPQAVNMSPLTLNEAAEIIAARKAGLPPTANTSEKAGVQRSIEAIAFEYCDEVIEDGPGIITRYAFTPDDLILFAAALLAIPPSTIGIADGK